MGKIRNTKQKQLIYTVLSDANRPLTAGELYERALKVQPAIAKSTIYRNLENMLSQGELVHGWMDNGESFYCIAPENGHKHFMICKSCKRMLDLPTCPLDTMEKEISNSSGFKITDHMIQIYGYCNDCLKNKNKP